MPVYLSCQRFFFPKKLLEDIANNNISKSKNKSKEGVKNLNPRPANLRGFRLQAMFREKLVKSKPFSLVNKHKQIQIML